MDIGKNIQESFGLYSRNFGTLFLGTLIGGFLSVITLGILAGPLTAGMLVLCLKLSRGEKAEWKEIFAHFDQFLPTFLATLLLWAATAVVWIMSSIPLIGWIIQIVASPALGLLYILTIGFIVDQKMQLMNAARRSVDYFAADPLSLWFAALLFGILGSIGVILFGIGVILTAPIALVGFTLIYKNLSGRVAIAFNPDKKKLQIAGIVVGVLIIGGIISLAARPAHKAGMGISGRIFSGITGHKVKMDRSGENFRIGDVSIGTSLPDDFPKDIPVYPKAEIGGHLSGGNDEAYSSTTTFSASDDAEEVYKFYMDKLESNGWQTETIQMGDMRIINLSKDNRKAVITINPSGSQTDILISTGVE